MFRLLRNFSNRDEGIPLVNISANCRHEGTCKTLTSPSVTLSRTSEYQFQCALSVDHEPDYTILICLTSTVQIEMTPNI
jgi:hypothetical protein